MFKFMQDQQSLEFFRKYRQRFMNFSYFLLFIFMPLWAIGFFSISLFCICWWSWGLFIRIFLPLLWHAGVDCSVFFSFNSCWWLLPFVGFFPHFVHLIPSLRPLETNSLSFQMKVRAWKFIESFFFYILLNNLLTFRRFLSTHILKMNGPPHTHSLTH